jgi:hypothetical protein
MPSHPHTPHREIPMMRKEYSILPHLEVPVDDALGVAEGDTCEQLTHPPPSRLFVCDEGASPAPRYSSSVVSVACDVSLRPLLRVYGSSGGIVVCSDAVKELATRCYLQDEEEGGLGVLRLGGKGGERGARTPAPLRRNGHWSGPDRPSLPLLTWTNSRTSWRARTFSWRPRAHMTRISR